MLVEQNALPPGRFRWSEKDRWHPEVLGMLSDLVDKKVIRQFRSDPPYCIASDDLTWLDRIVEKVKRRPSVDMKAIVTTRLQERYPEVVAFHACRPANLESYKTHGLRPCDPERLQAQAREIFGDSDRLEAAIHKLREGASYTYEEHNSGKVFFCLTLEELVESCGHYLLYGSEYLLGIAGPLGKQNTLRKIGKATVIECCIPSSMIPPTYWKCLAGNVIADIFQKIADPDYEEGIPTFGFPIYGSLPPEAILQFHHPTRIPNPLKLMIRED